ncbi:flavin reductase [Pseudoduganella namucuonensis]|uniref:3-hydroxy-9,10-secoandrosta-1,3,5(10)-triene-9,17-dione monooxygenase reductase component n=1 Tax=Pseudoduganella namucuonensis TaxID=1035707 RepID=A0A1I7LS88_9BURK|nr:flavin reductase [Pseudoduganella namucuonensis]SFV12542.1 3-hydroxy-9,10-secoandrosta-1,3,5(10)-triene-9,17-dione monooxygenase reductase component [Pseudoduganella namucuonensis]
MTIPQPFDQREFRRTLGTFTTGVTIITARAADGAPVGITANSFNSVSLDPPMVLWSLAKTSRSLAAFNDSDHWAVHILSVDQDALSNRFAKSGEDKFHGVATEAGAGGVPLLTGCTARLQCKSAFRYDGGDHIIFVGEVCAFDRSDSPPLVFHGGKYAIAASKSDKDAFSRDAPPSDASFSENFIGYLLARAHFQFYSQVRGHARAHGLSDAEYFVLTVLSARDGRPASDLIESFAYTGHAVSAALLEGLGARGLLTVSDCPSRLCRLSDQGRAATLQVLAAAKALEADMVAKCGEWEMTALKNLLKQCIAHTDPGLAHPWDVCAPGPLAS